MKMYAIRITLKKAKLYPRFFRLSLGPQRKKVAPSNPQSREFIV